MPASLPLSRDPKVINYNKFQILLKFWKILCINVVVKIGRGKTLLGLISKVSGGSCVLSSDVLLCIILG